MLYSLSVQCISLVILYILGVGEGNLCPERAMAPANDSLTYWELPQIKWGLSLDSQTGKVLTKSPG